MLNKASKEIDFLAIKNGKEYLIQVAYNVAEAGAYDRKFALFEVKMPTARPLNICSFPMDTAGAELYYKCKGKKENVDI